MALHITTLRVCSPLLLQVRTVSPSKMQRVVLCRDFGNDRSAACNACCTNRDTNTTDLCGCYRNDHCHCTSRSRYDLQHRWTTYTNTTGVFTTVAPGTYSVTVKNATGCISAVTSVTYQSQPATPAAPTATPTQPTCAVATGTITVTAPAPAAGITYSIDGTTYTNTTGVFTHCCSRYVQCHCQECNGLYLCRTSVTIDPSLLLLLHQPSHQHNRLVPLLPERSPSLHQHLQRVSPIASMD